MSDLIQFLVSGLALGAMYGLIALGFVIIFKATETLNFAHGALLLLGTYVVARLSGLPFWLAAVIGVAIAGLLMLLIERLLVRSMAGRAGLSITIMTIGLEAVLLTLGRDVVGVQILPLGDPWGSQLWHVGSITIPVSSVAALITAAVVVAAFTVWFQRSKWGVAFRASTERRDVAVLMGMRLGTISALAWGLAGALAIIAGIFLSTFPSPGVHVDLSLVALRALPAVIIGGLDSIHGALVGGLLVGLTEVLAQGYGAHLSFLGDNFHILAPYLLMFGILLFRPAGLFGSTAVNRA
jgi:branched-chain amino acid transport system permease protein